MYSIYSLQSKPNAWLIHIYTPIEYGILAHMLSSWQERRLVSNFISVSIPVYFTVYLMLKLSGVENFEADTINYVSRPLSLLLVAGFASYTLNRLCTGESSFLLRSYRFWILLAIVVYYSGSTIIVAFMYLESRTLLVQLFYAHAILNILHNILFTIGVLLAFASNPNERTVTSEEYR